MSEMIVRMEWTSKAFPGVQALDKVTFTCRKGEVHALVGENGAGKSTLIKILGGVFQPDEGKIVLQGKEIVFKTPNEAQRAGINIVHQEFNLVPYMTVAENIFLGQERRYVHLGFINSSELRHQAEEILDLIGFYLDPDSLVINLSAAQQKIVEIAKVLATKAIILVVDEPSAPFSREELKGLFKLINRLKNEGTTIIYISHRLEEIFEIADSVTVLKDGKKIATRDIQEVDEDDIIKMMIGRELGDMFPKKSSKIKREKILSIRNLSREGTLYNINLDLYKGEILGIAGLKGHGQRVLLKTIFGVYSKDKGEILIDGKKAKINGPKDAKNYRMALITDKKEVEGLCPALSVRQNTALPTLDKRQYFGFIKTQQEIEAVKKAISDLSIQTPSLSKIVRYLSGGNKQKVVIGKWLIDNPRIVLFIDPTMGIDVGTKAELYHLMRQLAETNEIGILVVSSEMKEMLGLCDRVVVMHNGRIAAEFSAEEASEEKIMRAAVGKDMK